MNFLISYLSETSAAEIGNAIFLNTNSNVLSTYADVYVEVEKWFLQVNLMELTLVWYHLGWFLKHYHLSISNWIFIHMDEL